METTAGAEVMVRGGGGGEGERDGVGGGGKRLEAAVTETQRGRE